MAATGWSSDSSFREHSSSRLTERGTCRPPLGLSPSCLFSATDSRSLAQIEVRLESQLKVQGTEVTEDEMGSRSALQSSSVTSVSRWFNSVQNLYWPLRAMRMVTIPFFDPGMPPRM